MNEIRKEFKFLYSNVQLLNFLDFYGFKMKKLFPDRVVHSLYLDTANFDLFKQSLEIDVDKEKLRYRRYDESNLIFFEKKLNSSLGKFKEKKQVNFKSFSEIESLFYKGISYTPMLQVSYLREYYNFKNARITIDKNLKFSSTKNRTLNSVEKELNINIVEFKLYSSDKDIESLFIDNPVAFSKFCEGTKLIYSL